MLKNTNSLVYTFIFCIGLFFMACQPTTPTENKSTENSNQNEANIPAKDEKAGDNSAKSTDSAETSVIETREPEKYSAKIKLQIEAVGSDNKASLPSIEAKFARSGKSKRMEFNVPTGQKIVYLEIDGKNLILLPEKKQFAEINKEAVGMDVRSMMTPEQIVSRAKSIKGLEKVGEEKYNGREATKYQYKDSTESNTKAGEIETDSYVYVDKETGLPLKTVIVSQSKNANIKGFKGLKIVTEMSDINTEISEDLFAQPEGFEKIDEKQVRDQLNLVFNVLGQFLKQTMEQANSN